MGVNEHFRSQKRVFLRKQQEEHKLGMILGTMSLVFIVCQSVKIFPDIYELLFCKDETGKCDMNQIFMDLSHLLVCINSSTNFLIYYCQGEKFRRAWMETYGCFWCCCETRQPGSPAAMVRVPSCVGQNNSRTTATLLSRKRSSCSTGSAAGAAASAAVAANGPKLNQLTVSDNGQSLSQTTSTSLVSNSQHSFNKRQIGRNGAAHI